MNKISSEYRSDHHRTYYTPSKNTSRYHKSSKYSKVKLSYNKS